jgi:hypothetical protein
MPEDVIAKLGQFTPATGLDRDELLFRAGRASAPSARGWKVAAGLLVVGQLATAVAWAAWPRPEPTIVRVPVEVPVSPPDEPSDYPPLPAGEPGASSYLVMSRSVSQGTLPAPQPSGGSSTEPTVILTAGSRGGVFE